jgi:hypothetical protein
MAIRIMGTRPLDMDTVIPPRRSGTDMDTGIRQRRSRIRLRSSSGAEWFTVPRYTAIGLLFDALTVSGQPRFTALRGPASIGRQRTASGWFMARGQLIAEVCVTE